MSDPLPDGVPDGSDPAALAQWLFDRARAGDTARVAAYVDAGAPVDMANENGDTMLMLAAYRGHAETVRALVERGADPGRANDRGQTPLAGAVFKGEAEVVQVLLEAGADPDAGTPSARETARMFGTGELLG
ncbi:hypothetical protein GA0111570_102275 [Raineyella antarctica]|uniref:Uncharacterized protein n=1 Tax=Raineyella antarctica TaxID=1577474 RepID=A0A1G6GFG0_9ACTN|nr:ankyrin repeat domain-containing protein [Raineyella antarctica]SDB80485.1 hypothetical protein GA0111570_102275 [Raineyella antarctica]